MFAKRADSAREGKYGKPYHLLAAREERRDIHVLIVEPAQHSFILDSRLSEHPARVCEAGILASFGIAQGKEQHNCKRGSSPCHDGCRQACGVDDWCSLFGWSLTRCELGGKWIRFMIFSFVRPYNLSRLYTEPMGARGLCIALLCSVTAPGVAFLPGAPLVRLFSRADPSARPVMSTALPASSEWAPAMAKQALSGLQLEYPHKVDHLWLATDGPLESPSALHPVFYGNYDWHRHAC